MAKVSSMSSLKPPSSRTRSRHSNMESESFSISSTKVTSSPSKFDKKKTKKQRKEKKPSEPHLKIRAVVDAWVASGRTFIV
jgi:hypothetical protein